jgi:DNA-binding transcriptional LysR family regulator
MLFNTYYFRVLCQSESISSAAEKLHISHQNLSKYLQNIERQYGTALFNRTPRLSLTEAGRAVLVSMQEVAIIEQNLQARLTEIKNSNVGILRVGAPEGRFRIVFPKILAHMRKLYPEVRIEPVAAPSYQLKKLLLLNELDVALIDKVFSDPLQFRQWAVLEEKLYLIVSDSLLKKYYPDINPDNSSDRKEIDLAKFLNFPFIMNTVNSISRRCVDEWLLDRHLQITPVLELPQLDVQILLSSCDYGACFCWSMYLPFIAERNQLQGKNRLHVFSLKNFPARNQILLASLKSRTLPVFGKTFCHLIRDMYASLALPDSFNDHSIMSDGLKEE